MTLGRRKFLGQAGGALVAAGLGGCATGTLRSSPLPSAMNAGSSPFSHGVASGDPLPDRVVIWTRAKPGDADTAVEVGWFCALDPGGTRRVAEGTLMADPARDHTLAIDVTGLAPGTTYYYGFSALGWYSPVGRTRTAPLSTTRARFAVVSCSNYSQGFFHAYARIAELEELDAVVHLGDYIYEYGADKYSAGAALGRLAEPPHELVTLDDYRRRYAQYRSDPDLQAAHARHPFIAVWDDHEVANNAWLGGAENHDPADGSWQARLAAATRAYMEWLPIRPSAGHLYRAFQFGALCDLVMLDSRIVGRDAQVGDHRNWARLMDPTRSLLGQPQERWLHESLARSQARGATWRLLGQQTMMGQLRRPDGIGNDDQWDGYDATRVRLFDAIERGGIDNLVVLTGDIHSSWAIDLARDPFDAARYSPRTGAGALATELICPGITSPSPYLKARLKRYPDWVRATHPHVKYLEGVRRGFILLDVTDQRVRSEWHLLDTVTEATSAIHIDAICQVDAGRAHVRRLPSTTAAPTADRRRSIRSSQSPAPRAG